MSAQVKLTIVVAVLTLLTAGGWYFSTRTGSGQPEPNNTPPDSADQGQLQIQRQNDLALARADYVSAIRTGEEAQNKLDDLDAIAMRWETEIVPLLTNDDGKHIASSDDQVRAFRALYAQVELPTTQTTNSLRTELDAVLKPLQDAVANNTITGLPNPELTGRINELAAKVDELSAPVTSSEQQLHAMVTAAKRENPRAGETLKTKFDEIDAAEAAQAGARLAKQRDDQQAQLAKMREDEVKQLAEEERLAELARLEAERLEREAERKKQELEALAKREAIRDKLAPFIEKTLARPRTERAGRFGKPTLRWERASTPEPMSIDAIRVFGVLDGEKDEQKARERLQFLATHEDNDRSDWPIATNDWDAVEEVRQLLIKLGPTLVDLEDLRTN